MVDRCDDIPRTFLGLFMEGWIPQLFLDCHLICQNPERIRILIVLMAAMGMSNLPELAIKHLKGH